MMPEPLSLKHMQRLCEEMLAELNLSACVLLGWQDKDALQCVYAVHKMKTGDTVNAMAKLMHEYARRATLPASSQKQSPSALLAKSSALLSTIQMPSYIAVCIRLSSGGYRVVYSTRRLKHTTVMAGMSWALKRYTEKNIKN